MEMKNIFRIIQISFIFFLALSTSVNAQLKVESNGNIKVGAMPYSQFNSRFEITEHSNKPLEMVLYSSSENISRMWVSNSLNAFGLGVNEKGLAEIYLYDQTTLPIMTFCPNGNIGFEKIPQYKLDVNGIARVDNLLINSFEQLRHKVKPIENQSNRLFLLNAISYHIRNNKKEIEEPLVQLDGEERLHYGFIVSEVEELFPELIYKDEKGHTNIDYISLIPLLLNELRQQKDDITMLKNCINTNKTSE